VSPLQSNRESVQSGKRGLPEPPEVDRAYRCFENVVWDASRATAKQSHLHHGARRRLAARAHRAVVDDPSRKRYHTGQAGSSAPNSANVVSKPRQTQAAASLRTSPREAEKRPFDRACRPQRALSLEPSSRRRRRACLPSHPIPPGGRVDRNVSGKQRRANQSTPSPGILIWPLGPVFVDKLRHFNASRSHLFSHKYDCAVPSWPRFQLTNSGHSVERAVMGKRSPHEATCPRIASGFLTRTQYVCLPLPFFP
jgi:hypothetical protein